jgi:hypothetical protein
MGNSPGAIAAASGDPMLTLVAAVRDAVLAPSGHNTQPWHFRLGADHVDLHADRTRRLPVVDPDDRALVISCGAALGLLRLSLRQHGFAGAVTLLPDAAQPDWLARIALGGAHVPDDEDRALHAAIARRHTARTTFAPDPLPATLAPRLAAIAADAGLTQQLVQDAAGREAIAALVEEGDWIQFADPAFRAELADWIRTRALGATDGLSARNFGAPDLVSPLVALAIRHRDMGAAQGAKDHALAAAGPALLLLGTATDTPRDWLAAGEALALMLLAATTAGVRAAFLNQPVEVPALRPRLRQVAGLEGIPQVLLRLGLAPEAPASARRDLEEVIERAADPAG